MLPNRTYIHTYIHIHIYLSARGQFTRQAFARRRLRAKKFRSKYMSLSAHKPLETGQPCGDPSGANFPVTGGDRGIMTGGSDTSEIPDTRVLVPPI